MEVLTRKAHKPARFPQPVQTDKEDRQGQLRVGVPRLAPLRQETGRCESLLKIIHLLPVER